MLKKLNEVRSLKMHFYRKLTALFLCSELANVLDHKDDAYLQ